MGALIIFVIFLFWEMDDKRMSMPEKIVFCSLLAAVWPAAICIIAVGLPFYLLHLLSEKHKKAKTAAATT